MVIEIHTVAVGPTEIDTDQGRNLEPGVLKNYVAHLVFERPEQRHYTFSPKEWLRDSLGDLSNIYQRLLTRTK